MLDEPTEELPTRSMQNCTVVVAREEQRRGSNTPTSTDLGAFAQRFVEMEQDLSLPERGDLHEDNLIEDRRYNGDREQHLGQCEASLRGVQPIEVPEHEHEPKFVSPVVSCPTTR